MEAVLEVGIDPRNKTRELVAQVETTMVTDVAAEPLKETPAEKTPASAADKDTHNLPRLTPAKPEITYDRIILADNYEQSAESPELITVLSEADDNTEPYNRQAAGSINEPLSDTLFQEVPDEVLGFISETVEEQTFFAEALMHDTEEELPAETIALEEVAIPEKTSESVLDEILDSNHEPSLGVMSQEVGTQIMDVIEKLEPQKLIELETLFAEIMYIYDVFELNETKTGITEAEMEVKLRNAHVKVAEILGIDFRLIAPAQLNAIIKRLKPPVPTQEYLNSLQMLGTHEFRWQDFQLLRSLKVWVDSMQFHNWLGRSALLLVKAA